MMNIDIRVIFENWIAKAQTFESEKKYTFALLKYQDAYEIANAANDSAKIRAEEGIKRCKQKISENNEDFTK